jgi:hypothetical protein
MLLINDGNNLLINDYRPIAQFCEKSQHWHKCWVTDEFMGIVSKVLGSGINQTEYDTWKSHRVQYYRMWRLASWWMGTGAKEKPPTSISYPDDGGSRFLFNVRIHLQGRYVVKI